MAHTKSVAKSIRVAKKSHLRNKSVKSKIKTVIKNIEKDITENNSVNLADSLKAAYKEIDMAVSKGIIHKNKGARKKSRITLKANKAQVV